MRVDSFDFALPEQCIAQAPCEPRDAARMLVVPASQNADAALNSAHIRDFPAYLNAGDVLVVNATRVIPARLWGMRHADAEGGSDIRVEILLHQPITPEDTTTWRVFARPAKRLKLKQIITIAPDFSAQVQEKLSSGEVVLTFVSALPFWEALQQYGEPPLPPYIARPDGASKEDAARYQTCYAKTPGSVAAPTAGLHFTPALLDALRAKGVEILEVTLHVGAGTFQPVKVEDTSEHQMHSEWGEVSANVASSINAARARGGRVVCVGTTSLRVLESATLPDGTVQPFCGNTDIFITPGYRFRAVDVLLTNFHLPRSTLFMLVCALAGQARMQTAYQHAIAGGYRFYSYGDACLLERVNMPDV